jgi:alanine-synthesizing transaminase
VFSRRTNWPLTPNRFTAAVERHRAAGKQVLDLTASNPTTIGLHYNSAAILSGLSNAQAVKYEPDPKGLRLARDTVAAYYQERGTTVDPERIILTTSTSEAYSFIFRLLCEPGDEVLIAAPSYPLFEILADLQDVHLKSYPLFYDHGWHIDLHALAASITDQTRAVMVVHPNNPTGSYVQPNEAEQLHALCGQHQMAIVADEVFLDFAHTKAVPPSFVGPIIRCSDHLTENRQPKTENETAVTFTLSGLSKIAGLPQMKFAWIVVSGPDTLVIDAVARVEIIADTYLSMNAPIQLAAPALFETRHAFQRQLMQRITTNLAELDRQLSTAQTCRRLEIEGGWYAVLRVPATRSDEDLAIDLLEKHSVLVHPGHFYDFSSDGYLVLSLIAPEEEFSEAVKRLLEFVIADL